MQGFSSLIGQFVWSPAFDWWNRLSLKAAVRMTKFWNVKFIECFSVVKLYIVSDLIANTDPDQTFIQKRIRTRNRALYYTFVTSHLGDSGNIFHVKKNRARGRTETMYSFS